MHQFVSIKFSCLIESNVSSVWHWVMSHCCDISDIWPIRGQYCVPLTNKKPDNEMNGLSLRCCDSLDRPVVTRVSLTMDPGGDQRRRPRASHIAWCHRKGRSHFVLWSHYHTRPRIQTIIRPPSGSLLFLEEATRSGDINAGPRIDHDWAWALEWRQLVCWELWPLSAWCLVWWPLESHTSLNTWEGLTLETNNHETTAYIYLARKLLWTFHQNRRWCSVLAC